jgi:hypothetical protein
MQCLHQVNTSNHLKINNRLEPTLTNTKTHPKLEETTPKGQNNITTNNHPTLTLLTLTHSYPQQNQNK